MGRVPFAFVEGALDRADALRDDHDALAALWPRARVLLLDDDGRAGADAAQAPFAPTGADLGGGPGSAVFLGLREGAGWLGRCGACGSEHYPRTDQALIAAVGDGHRLLLGRQKAWPPRRWSVLAGFVEPGESLEQTVAREVFEESRVRVRAARYLASQPWPFPGSLMLGFLADAEPDVPVPGDELEEVRWFGVDEIRAGLERPWSETPPDGAIALSTPMSIARWLIERWLAEAEGRATAGPVG